MGNILHTAIKDSYMGRAQMCHKTPAPIGLTDK